MKNHRVGKMLDRHSMPCESCAVLMTDQKAKAFETLWQHQVVRNRAAFKLWAISSGFLLILSLILLSIIPDTMLRCTST